jgi:putative ABC transport system permease protein
MEMRCLWQDFRFGIRVLWRNPGFTAVAIAALALGIGANSCIFSVVYGILLKPLPYRDPGRLVRVYEFNPIERFEKFPLSPADFLDYRKQNSAFQDIAAYVRQDQQYGGERPERVTAVRVSYRFFELFGVQPLMGSTFTHEQEANTGPADVAIISYSFWQRILGGDPHVIGKTVILTDSPFRIVGVMKPDFEHVSGGYQLPRGEGVEVWLPYNWLANRRVARASHYTNTLARLKPGITLEQAQAEMNVIAGSLEAQYPDDKNWRIQLKPLQDDLVGSARPTLLILSGAVGFVLLIACVNVANLLLARATVREREMAIRAAVGASRARLVAQMLTESVTLAALGALFGLLLAWYAVRALVNLGPDQVPRLHTITLDIRVVLVTAAVAILAGLLFGLAPAISASTTKLRRNSPRGIFVVSEVALTFVLLIGAGLLLRSFLALGRVDPGFYPQGVLTMNVSVSWAKLGGARKYTAFFESLVERLAQLPGVTAAGASSGLPWTGAVDNALFGIEGRTKPANGDMHAHYLYVSPDYLRAIGVPLVAGRWLTTADHFDAPKVVLVNKALALHYWPTAEACLGQRIHTWRDTADLNSLMADSFMTIVGVIGDVKDAPTDAKASETFYPPILQNPTFGTYVALRATTNASALIPAARQIAKQMGNDLSVQEIRPLEQIVAASVATQRFALQVIGLFAIVALVLAVIGIYGVMSFAANRRAKEVAIRVALGATPADTLGLMLGHGLHLIVAGLLVGGLAAVALTRALSSILYQVSTTDPLTFAGVALLLALTAIAACFIPAAKMLRIDPVESLRHE